MTVIKRKRDEIETAALDPGRKKEFEAAFQKHGCVLTLFLLTNQRYNYWHIRDPESGATMSTGFDVDIPRILSFLDRGIKLEYVDITRYATAARVSVANSNAGGPFCVVCEGAGGLPCPNLVTTAKKLNIRLAVPYDDVRIGPAHIHPGGCRKRIKQLIESGQKLEGRS
jgi:hypothetical protein